MPSDIPSDIPRIKEVPYEVPSTEVPRRSHKRLRRVGRPSRRVRVEPATQKTPTPELPSGPMDVRTWIREIEDTYFSPRESTFWHFYRNVHSQALFVDVPSLGNTIRHCYGGSKKTVIWEYHNDKVLEYRDTIGYTSWVNRENVRFIS